jgi:hypothetical protein
MKLPLVLVRVLLVWASVVSSVQAEEQEWVLRIKNEAKNLSITLGQTTLYGSGGQRVKGSGHLVERARPVAAFSRVRLDGPIDVRLSSGAAESLKVSADDNLEPLVTTVVEGDTLIVGVKPGSAFSTRHPLRVSLEFKQLQALEVLGSGDAALDRWQGDRLRLEMSGSGDVSIGLIEARELSAALSGSGDLALAGQADRIDFVLSGSGDVSASSLSEQDVRATLSGSGDLRLGVSRTLEVKLSGSGDLRYAGRPKVTSQVSGSGELMPR